MLNNTSFILVVFILIGKYSSAQFSQIDAEQSNLKFSNLISETEQINILNFDYLYNGGGVGIIDINKDGLEDIFLTGNFVDDKLYLNQGDFKFKDVSEEYGILNHGWSTGVCIFDINNDGYEDIYVCRSGIDSLMSGTNNVLYINQNGKGFKESAQEYGLDIKRNSVQAAPLDFDLDGDLDLYIITHPPIFKHVESFSNYYSKIIKGQINSDILLENRDGKFYDITKAAGIFEYGYSLGLAITDLNLDDYPDIIVSNDFDEPDHIFINQKNGKFNDETLQYFRHTSNYSMGNDVADFNNDGLLDYISLDMAFSSHERSKLNMASMQPEKFATRVNLGWNHQYMHNMLQLNTGCNSFSEISYLANVAKTDWSWAPLFIDVNADGWQDLLITNGYKRDTKNNDIQSKLDDYIASTNNLIVLDFLDLIPSVKIRNHVLVNQKDLTFRDNTANYGLNVPVNSNGMAYADFNNDGLLDIIINNIDTTPFLYQNILSTPYNYLQVDFSNLSEGDWIGSKLTLNFVESKQVKEAYFIRGFQSSVSKKYIFYWEDGNDPVFLSVVLNDGRSAKYKVNKRKVLSPELSDFKTVELVEETKINKLFENISEQTISSFHQENEFNDFKVETLLPHRMSSNGPIVKVSDLNNDGLQDVILGSSSGHIPSVYLQNVNKQFIQVENPAFYNNQLSEIEDFEIVDLNGDGNKDLFFSYGGYEFLEGSPNLKGSIYLGDGNGKFGKVQNDKVVDDIGYNSGRIILYDFNKDGLIDYLICGKASPLNYPRASKTSILMNNQGFLQDFTQAIAPGIESIGIVEDAIFSDVDKDGDQDLILVGEWMDLTIFLNEKGHYSLLDQDFYLNGWWNRMIAYDFDHDGDDDLLVGNAGINNKFNPGILNPLHIYLNDFDGNQTNDVVISVTSKDQELPLRGKECSSGQMPFLNDKFRTFESFAKSNLEEIYSKEKLDSSYHKKAVEFRSGIIENKGNLKFEFHAFDNLAQTSSINDFVMLDVNLDGMLDIIAVGNDYGTEVETTRNDAGTGLVLIQESGFKFKTLTSLESGFYVEGDAKSIEEIKLANGKTGIIVGVNSGRVHMYELH